mmetsp:Transcript_12733/g.20035  ORF Transcript_12733/g.20035 Transcript_12733/m.20035 type:complete len:99 (+) Transcript_12733:698-994(+)
MNLQTMINSTPSFVAVWNGGSRDPGKAFINVQGRLSSTCLAQSATGHLLQLWRGRGLEDTRTEGKFQSKVSCFAGPALWSHRQINPWDSLLFLKRATK